ncbi:putative oxidoreductase C terminal-domain-containing protein [Kockovaella imperatae]|uniref:Putative oxidoreductase C terminal-domain-containing protein n=1 Tax=Kockovaella imperatae TaxID=4999 RepID=A0A1Y1UF15_9TREE|nr:putative oxidoreductase C terminal-domain-containing protein [Kockovaella imperatae]ORX36612.1 putative oxidoreductase C terminal-domain-containing protein [Kockovaella imperatae]
MTMSNKFNVLILGAGRINFGSTEASWAHSLRLEKKLGPALNVVGLVDINVAYAEKIIASKRAIEGLVGYEHTKVFKTVADAEAGLSEEEMPKLVVNGLPANYRGTTIPNHDLDVQVAKLFPTAAQFIEKPISAGSLDDVTQANEELQKGGLTSVGYMLRYLQAVTEMKKIIAENNLTVMCTQATYLMAYKYAGLRDESIDYWDMNGELGPIVGQGTHLVDLSRYFCPDPVHDSIRVHTVEASDKPGKLSQLTIKAESELPADRKIPRITNAIWRYESGATGSIIHGTCIHEGDYDCELVVLADGWKLRLVDPYGVAPRLYVRRPGTTSETMTEFKNDDPYYNEFSDLVDVIQGKANQSAVRSTFTDAMKTYKFTWAIRWAGEVEARARGARQ